MIRTLSLFAALLLLAGCGVKNDLVLPDGKPTKGRHDPSRPPLPIGE